MNIFLKEALLSVRHYDISFIKSIKETLLMNNYAKENNIDVELLKIFPNDSDMFYFYVLYFFNKEEMECIKEIHKRDFPNALISTDNMLFEYFSLKKRGEWPKPKRINLSKKWDKIV